jgi:Fur family transcriptional regulator, ferric uptake regulator
LNFIFTEERALEGAAELFEEYLRGKGLNLTSQRRDLLDVFLSSGRHLTVEELYNLAKKKNPRIGQATVFRTLKLLAEADLARKVVLGDNIARYEIKYGVEHHDHLVCVECGKFIEAVDPAIEELQKKLCKKFGFSPRKHSLEIFGYCRACRKKL